MKKEKIKLYLISDFLGMLTILSVIGIISCVSNLECNTIDILKMIFQLAIFSSCTFVFGNLFLFYKDELEKMK